MISDSAVERLERHIDQELHSLREWIDKRLDKLQSQKEPRPRATFALAQPDTLPGLPKHASAPNLPRPRATFSQTETLPKLAGAPDLLQFDSDTPVTESVPEAMAGSLYSSFESTPRLSQESLRGVNRSTISVTLPSMISDQDIYDDREFELTQDHMQMHPWWLEILRKPHSRDSTTRATAVKSEVRGHRLSLRAGGSFSDPFELQVLQHLHEHSGYSSLATKFIMTKLMAHPSSTWRLAWGILGMLLIVYDVITIPVFIAFEPAETNIIFALGLFTTVYWTIDLVLTFFVGYWRKGSLELRPRHVAMNYLRTWFVMDMAIVSFDWAILIYIRAQDDSGGKAEQSARLGKTFRASRSIRTLRLVRSLRLVKLLKIIGEVRDYISSEYVHISFDIIRNVLAIVFLNHIVACIWFGIGAQPFEGGWVRNHGLLEESINYQYASSLHWSLTQFTPASMEVYPQNFSERSFAISAVVVALIVFSSFIASITTAMLRVRKLSGDSQTQLWLVRRYLKEHKVSPQLTMRIKRYLEFKTSREQRLSDPKNIKLLSSLSEHLKMDLEWEKTWPVLKKHPFFMRYGVQDAHAIGDICHNAIHYEFLTTGDVLFSEGTNSEGMYFIMRGTLEYFYQPLVTGDETATTSWRSSGHEQPRKSPSIVSRASVKSVKHVNSKLLRSRSGSGLGKCLPDTNNHEQSVELRAGEWCCEAALWAPWVHTGTMLSASIGEVAVLDAKKFKSICVKHHAVSNITANYAFIFVRNLNDLLSEESRPSTIGGYRSATGTISDNSELSSSTDLAENRELTEKRAAEAFGEVNRLDPMQEQALDSYKTAIVNRSVKCLHEAQQRCSSINVPAGEMASIANTYREESESAGICLAYVLSADFEKMARNATGKNNPSFLDMRDPFFVEPGPQQKLIGEGMLCPRDLKVGCAFIDTLQPSYRRRANAFLSWVWKYQLSTVQSALSRWAETHELQHSGIFLYMCFFCNNQWRIMIEKTTQGSDNLETVFEERLVKIGRCVALLDTWDDSVYIGRIWTIYEQYVAAKVGVKMEFTLPEHPAATLIQQLERGKDGIQCVIEAISTVDAEHAKATVEADEHKVKALIRKSIGFDSVNTRVQSSISDWIAGEFKANIDKLVQQANCTSDRQAVANDDNEKEEEEERRNDMNVSKSRSNDTNDKPASKSRSNDTNDIPTFRHQL